MYGTYETFRTMVGRDRYRSLMSQMSHVGVKDLSAPATLTDEQGRGVVG